MKAYIKILRPDEALMMSMPIVIIAIVGHHFSISVFLATILVFLMAGAGNVINDVFDYKIDAVNKPDRPIPSGKISLKNARIYAGTLYAVSAVLSLIISSLIHNYLFSAIIVCSAVIIYAYSRYFKAMPLVGNIVVGGMIGFCFVVGGFILLCNTQDREIFRYPFTSVFLPRLPMSRENSLRIWRMLKGIRSAAQEPFPFCTEKKYLR